MEKVRVFRKLIDHRYDWNNFINFFNYSLQNPRPEEQGQSYAKSHTGHVNFWHNFTMTIDGLNDLFFPKLNNIVETLSNILQLRNNGMFAAVSLTNIEPTTGKHSDPVNVAYLNCVGSVQWDTYDGNNIVSYILDVGDVIFIPAGIEHEVISVTPRAAISFMFGDKVE
jgi:hypothetical protein